MTEGGLKGFNLYIHSEKVYLEVIETFPSFGEEILDLCGNCDIKSLYILWRMYIHVIVAR